MQTKKLEVKCECPPTRFRLTIEQHKHMFFNEPLLAEMIADMEQKWGEPRLPTND